MVLTSKEIIAHLFQQEHFSEEFQSSLNVNKTSYLKVDPLASTINFQRHKDSDHLLSKWSRKLNSPMFLVSKATHLITMEEMIHILQGAVIILQFFSLLVHACLVYFCMIFVKNLLAVNAATPNVKLLRRVGYWQYIASTFSCTYTLPSVIYHSSPN